MIARPLVVFACFGVLVACGKKAAPPPAPVEDVAAKVEDAAAKVDDVAAKVEDAAAKVEDVAAKVADAAARTMSVTAKSPKAVELFVAARVSAMNFRISDALASLQQALALDADFLLAQAFAAYLTPGPAAVDALAGIDQAAAGLPAAERAFVAALLAERQGDNKATVELERKVTELAPDDWFAWAALGMRTMTSDREGATRALERAAALAPKQGVVFNTLGYVYLNANRKDEAIAAFQKYVALNPDEPNALDSLAEAQLAAGQLAEAEATFVKAASGPARFPMAWYGAATARMLLGQKDAAIDALQKGIDASERAEDRNLGMSERAKLDAVRQDVQAAVDGLAALETEALKGAAVAGAAWAACDRAWLLVNAGRVDEADKVLAAALERAEKGPVGALKGDELAGLRARAGWIATWIAVKRGQAEAAQKQLAALEELVKAAPDSAFMQSLVQDAKGATLMATDAKAAAEAFAACWEHDFTCHWHEAVARKAAGDEAGAAAATKRVVDTPHRDMQYAWVRAQLDGMK